MNLESYKSDGREKSPLPRLWISMTVFFTIMTIIVGSILVAEWRETARFNSENRDVALRSLRLWTARIGLALTEEISIARSLEGLVVASSTTVPLHSSHNLSDRVQEVPLFGPFARRLWSQWVLSVQLQPSGIVWQVFPNGSGPIGFDLLNSEQHSDEVQEMIDSQMLRVSGPVNLVQGGIAMIVRMPVFLNLTHPSRRSWWGNIAVLVELAHFISELEMESLIELPFALADGSGGRVLHNSSDWQPQALGDALRDEVVLPSGWRLVLFVEPKRDSISKREIGTAFLAALLTASCLTVAFNLAFMCRNRQKQTAQHAPKIAPFFLVLVDIMWSRKLWRECPEEMIFIVEQLDEIITDAAQQSKCYKANQTTRRVSCIASRSFERALECAELIVAEALTLDMAPEVQRQLFLHSLPIRVSIHHCTRASVSAECSEERADASSAYQYRGRDVQAAEALHHALSAYTIYVSDSARGFAKERSAQLARLFVQLRGGEQPVVVWTLLRADADEPREMAMRRVGEGAEMPDTSFGDSRRSSIGGAASHDKQNPSPLLPASEAQSEGDLLQAEEQPLPLRKPATGAAGRLGDAGSTSPRSSMLSFAGNVLRTAASSGSIASASQGQPVAGLASRSASSMVVPVLADSDRRHHDDGTQYGGDVFGALSRRYCGDGGTRNSNVSFSARNSLTLLGHHQQQQQPLQQQAHLSPAHHQLFRIATECGEDVLVCNGQGRVILGIVFDCYVLLFSAFRSAERANVLQRLRLSFGLPATAVLEHLAVRATISFVDDIREENRGRPGDESSDAVDFPSTHPMPMVPPETPRAALRSST